VSERVDDREHPAGGQSILHEARLGPWSIAELKKHLAEIVDGIAARDRAASPESGMPPDVSPFDIALELLIGELKAFVLFGQTEHLDPPPADGKVSVLVFRCESKNPEINVAIREAAKKWAIDQEARS